MLQALLALPAALTTSAALATHVEAPQLVGSWALVPSPDCCDRDRIEDELIAWLEASAVRERRFRFIDADATAEASRPTPTRPVVELLAWRFFLARAEAPRSFSVQAPASGHIVLDDPANPAGPVSLPGDARRLDEFGAAAVSGRTRRSQLIVRLAYQEGFSEVDRFEASGPRSMLLHRTVSAGGIGRFRFRWDYVRRS